MRNISASTGALIATVLAISVVPQASAQTKPSAPNPEATLTAKMNAYVGCRHPGEAHAVQFLICRACGMAAEIDDPALDAALAHSATDVGFTIESRVVELAGLCARCKAAGAGV